MKKSICFICVLFSVLAVGFCQQTTIEDVFSTFMTDRVTSGDFIQEKNAAKLKRPLRSSGKFIFCDEGILWQTLKPFPSTMAVTKTSIIQTKADGSKTVTDGSSNQVFTSVAETLSSIFCGDKTKLESFFNIKDFKADSKNWSVLLTPKDSTIASTLKEIELSGSVGKKSTLDNLKIFQGETDSTFYTLLNQQYRQELSNEEKSFFK